MSWHYQIRERSDKGEKYFDVVEVFDVPGVWTCHCASPLSETATGVINNLQAMLRDAASYPVLIEKEEE